MKSRIYVSAIMLLTFSVNYSWAQVFPYVESSTCIVNNTGVANNTGFKSSTLRKTRLTIPTPMHSATSETNALISPRFAVAKSNLTSAMNWAQACGWSSSANTSSSNPVVATPATGCNAYSESGAPAGTWRMPTKRELYVIYIVQKDLVAVSGFTTFIGAFWTASNTLATEADAINMEWGVSWVDGKIKTYNTRCIRDL